MSLLAIPIEEKLRVEQKSARADVIAGIRRHIPTPMIARAKRRTLLPSWKIRNSFAGTGYLKVSR
jgi:hypothetical protein